MKFALVGVILVGVLIAAGSVAYLANPPARASAKVDRAALVKAAARQMFAAANRNDAHAFCHSFSEKVVKDAGAQEGMPDVKSAYHYCEVNAAQPHALDGYHVRKLYVAPKVVFQDGQARVRARLDGQWFFFYFRRDSDGVWRFTNAECLSCGTPGGVRSADAA